MKIEVDSGLPFVTVSLTHGDQQINLKNVLLDTGSEGTIFATDTILAIGLKMELDDMVRRIRGVGGAEFVFDKKIDCISLGDMQAKNFEIEVGAMAYGFPIDGIIGLDFLLKVGACIDLPRLKTYQCTDLMKTQWYEYDKEGDVLDVYFGTKRPAWSIELTPNIMISIDRTNKEPVSLTLIDYTELVRPTSWGARSFPITGLADLPIEERDLILTVLNSPPVNYWLDISAVQMLPDSPLLVTHLKPPPLPVTELVRQVA